MQKWRAKCCKGIFFWCKQIEWRRFFFFVEQKNSNYVNIKVEQSAKDTALPSLRKISNGKKKHRKRHLRFEYKYIGKKSPFPLPKGVAYHRNHHSNNSLFNETPSKWVNHISLIWTNPTIPRTGNLTKRWSIKFRRKRSDYDFNV